MGIKEKRRIGKLLRSSDIESVIEELRQLPPSRVINPLIGALCSNDENGPLACYYGPWPDCR